MPDSNKTIADWSDLPDVYVTSVKRTDGVVWEITACSVPMAIGPEVRLIRADVAQAAQNAAVAAALERAAEIADQHLSKIEINEPLWHEGQDWAAESIALAILAFAAVQINGVYVETNADGDIVG